MHFIYVIPRETSHSQMEKYSQSRAGSLQGKMVNIMKTGDFIRSP